MVIIKEKHKDITTIMKRLSQKVKKGISQKAGGGRAEFCVGAAKVLHSTERKMSVRRRKFAALPTTLSAPGRCQRGGSVVK